MQTNFFEGRLVGSSENSGVSLPDFTKLAFGLPSVKIDSVDGLAELLPGVLGYDGPIVCEVMIDPNYIFVPNFFKKISRWKNDLCTTRRHVSLS